MIQRIANALIKRWGTATAKQRVWDSEYKTGRWTYQRGGQNNEGREPVYGFLEKYGAGGSILDLGCGSGMTALEMRNNFREYVGVDISEIAVGKARVELCKEIDRAHKTRFFASDISSFQPDRKFSVILFRESIYYVPQHQIGQMINRYCSHLCPGGVFIVRVCDKDTYKGIIRLLETNLQVTDTYFAQDSKMVILACSPRGEVILD